MKKTTNHPAPHLHDDFFDAGQTPVKPEPKRKRIKKYTREASSRPRTS